MRKLKLQVQISIDGYIADEKGKTDWMIWNWSEDWTWDKELQFDFTELKGSIDTVLLSRKMAKEGFIDHWASVSKKSDDPQSKFASIITAAKKVVFTNTLEKSEWENTVLAKGNLVEEVNNLKKQEGKDLLVYGGASFLSSLIEEDLVDEYYLFINPVALGEGVKMFTKKHKLKAVFSHTYGCGITVMKFIKL
jgi:dihydrofolate reductase